MTLVVGWPVLRGERVYEDQNAATLAQPWQGLRAEMQTWTRKPQRMLTTLTFQATDGWFGGSTVVDHAVNLAGIVLTVAVVSVLCPTVWGMVLAGALIGWHPLQTEGMAYLSARPDVLLGLCLALGLWAVERRSLVGACLASLAAFGAKESGVMVAPLLILWAAWRGFLSWRVLAALGAVKVALAVFLLFRYPLHPSAVPIAQAGAMLRQLIWPVGLTVDYDWSSYTQMGGLLVLIWAAALIAVCYACQRRQWALLIVGLGVWFLPRVLVPLSEGLHAHHVTGVMPWIAVCLTYPQKVHYGH